MPERCDYCGRRMDRPGSARCKSPHPPPHLSQTIVRAIEDELGDRRLGWEGLNDDTLDEVRDRLAVVVKGLVAAAQVHRNRELAGLLSEIADIARRIGVAANAEWVREQLEEIVNRYERWREIRFQREGES